MNKKGQAHLKSIHVDGKLHARLLEHCRDGGLKIKAFVERAIEKALRAPK